LLFCSPILEERHALINPIVHANGIKLESWHFSGSHERPLASDLALEVIIKLPTKRI
jgi:hypothetical protein